MLQLLFEPFNFKDASCTDGPCSGQKTYSATSVPCLSDSHLTLRLSASKVRTKLMPGWARLCTTRKPGANKSCQRVTTLSLTSISELARTGARTTQRKWQRDCGLRSASQLRESIAIVDAITCSKVPRTTLCSNNWALSRAEAWRAAVAAPAAEGSAEQQLGLLPCCFV